MPLGKSGLRYDKILLIIILTPGIIGLRYFVAPDFEHFHALPNIVHFLPILLASFWFGLMGALTIRGGFAIVYVPYIQNTWEGFSAQDLERILSGIIISKMFSTKIYTNTPENQNTGCISIPVVAINLKTNQRIRRKLKVALQEN